jgi:predicted acylesterase/phospholipase RssA
MTSFKDVLFALPDMSLKELETIIATAGSLKDSARRRAYPRQAKPVSTAKKKGPDKPVSKYLDNPDYLSFKAAERKLKAALKEANATLKEAEARRGTIKDSILDDFLSKRGHWFRSKIANKPAPSESKTQSEVKEQEASA